MSALVEVEDHAWLEVPELETLTQRAVAATLSAERKSHGQGEIVVLFTGDAAMTEINAQWRGQNKPTNVLSFPAPAGMPVPEGGTQPIGDIVLAHGVIVREARDQGKTVADHITHLIVHGTLHLLGHDHETDAQAEHMEQLEVKILKELGIADPYE